MINNKTIKHIRSDIIKKGESLGASLVGFTSVSKLKESNTYDVYDQAPYYDYYEGVEWSKKAKGVIVLALHHKRSAPELDWWRYDLPARTYGNEQLIKTAKNLSTYINKEYNINPTPLSYYVEKGGIFLKDAAVLAGLGIIGKNNLLITPQFGPRVRLKAIFTNLEFESTGPITFNPCEGCDVACFSACPQDAFADGSFSRELCDLQMGLDQGNQLNLEETQDEELPSVCRKYCRLCEFACPIP